MNKRRLIPKFKSEDEERKFWATHDTTVYFDTSRPFKLNLTLLKRSTKSITVRLPEWLVDRLKILANKRDVPYQSLLKIFLAEKVQDEMYGRK